jgi:hypothetical protein
MSGDVAMGEMSGRSLNDVRELSDGERLVQLLNHFIQLRISEIRLVTKSDEELRRLGYTGTLPFTEWRLNRARALFMEQVRRHVPAEHEPEVVGPELLRELRPQLLHNIDA